MLSQAWELREETERLQGQQQEGNCFPPPPWEFF